MNSRILALYALAFLSPCECPTAIVQAQQQRQEQDVRAYYKKWVEEDVTYIITPEEKAIFQKLLTSEEKEQFVEQFWRRRDPDPSTSFNEFKEEHYRRIAYANEQFRSGKSGWRTDRGRIYIMYGPPSERETHPGGAYERPYAEGGGRTSAFPFERWRFRYIEGIGSDVELEFVDSSMTGEYRLTIDPLDKDAWLYTPGGTTIAEASGLVSRADRIAMRNVGNPNNPYLQSRRLQDQPFERLQRYFTLSRPPAIKFKDLQSVVSSHITYGQLSCAFRGDYFFAWENHALAPITIELRNADLNYRASAEGVRQAEVQIYGRVETLSRGIAYEFEDILKSELKAAEFNGGLKQKSVYQRKIPVKPGRYKLTLVLKDAHSGKLGTLEKSLLVPTPKPGFPFLSSLILSERLIREAPDSFITDPFQVASGLKVYPSIDNTFQDKLHLGLYFEIYGLEGEGTNQMPRAHIEYSISRKGDEELIHRGIVSESGTRVPSGLAIRTRIPIIGLEPANYTLKVQVTDRTNGKTTQGATPFRISAGP